MIAIFRNKLKRIVANLKSERVKLNFMQGLPYWTASLLAGLLAVLYAKLFAWVEEANIFFLHTYKWSLLVITPVCFILGWWTIKRFSPFARGSGIPQIMASIELATPKEHNKIDRMLSVRVIVVKIISSLIMVFGGAIIGREGPTIQIAGSVFRTVNKYLPSWWPRISKKNMIITGAAAGLAAAFNTPLGGIVFAVEELSKTHISYFKTALFTAIIVAGLTAQALLGPYLYLGYPDVTHLSSIVFVWVILLAIIGGLFGSGVSKLMLYIMNWKSRFTKKYQNIFYLIIGGVLIALAGIFIHSDAIGSGKSVMTGTLFTPNKYVPWYLPFVRIAGLITSFTAGAAGGVFAPSLSIGASFGSWIAGLLHLSLTDTNLVILVGMVSFLTGVTRSPFTSAILVLEMTDRHNVIFYLMLAGLLANLVSLLIDRHSFYDHLKVGYLKEINHVDTSAEKPVPEIISTDKDNF
ncbi:chloride channel protein [Niastella koreensis]|uniref:Cl-channel voltage-gated family protein n=2 Tax=Niastella koreensis TaxID=354356 RepID=G8TBT2_NIAKG|nr:chloride channel protein [Niastella koreensis]AEV98214.1 Cl- channel voltage-gated family protein [Niastella koreensis GR20-10]OQP44323.1 chloride channel protein [Niastella koreensis]